jgi:hypothetical protein
LPEKFERSHDGTVLIDQTVTFISGRADERLDADCRKRISGWKQFSPVRSPRELLVAE